MADQRTAQSGELCTCGRQAVVVFITGQFGETGYCGVEGSAARPVLPCPWFGVTVAHTESWGIRGAVLTTRCVRPLWEREAASDGPGERGRLAGGRLKLQTP